MTNDRFYLSLSSVEVEDEMTTAAQPESLSTTNSDWIDGLSEEACRLHDAGMEAYGGGRVDEAEQFFRRALALFEQVDGGEHLDVAAVLGDLGAVLEAQCDYMAAEECQVPAATSTEATRLETRNSEAEK